MTTTNKINYYDDTLNDDCCDSDVLHARRAGRAWAEREYDAAPNPTSCPEWIASANDARSLVEFGPTSEVEDQHERELAEICNNEAARWWGRLCGSAR